MSTHAATPPADLVARADALATSCAALMRSPAGLVLPAAARSLIVDLVRLVRDLADSTHQPGA